MSEEKGRAPLSDSQSAGDGLFEDGEALHPLLELVEAAGSAVEELAWLLGRAGVEAILAARQSAEDGFWGPEASLP